ncbi:Mg2+-importing ATPase [Humibacillus xanthopallidus]|uniref:Magnesium-transporting ATPase, P-type 1 n=1 Tax=Humibacillus xanthopallidus TaxID=412689 RepID=A0A543PL02_9MICO|nr:magnesium-translocating P-type ATPase [Humibacillus xanthopallidus]TQN44753.1 Mg2+-importing ATPase [Humibacillus xanthopallidus]
MTVAPLVHADASAGIRAAATRTGAEVARSLRVDEHRGLDDAEVVRRRRTVGPNAIASHDARVLPVLWHQLRSPLLGLLLVAALASAFVGEGADAAIIGLIVVASVGLGFVNEYRAEKAAASLHSQVTHTAVVLREGRAGSLDVTALVPGDLVDLRLGEIVPADLRLLSATGLECDESVLTGESQPVAKDTGPTPEGASLAELAGCALMGTVVHAGSGRGVVVSTGSRTEFGAIAAGLHTHQADTPFQVGLRRFSMLLVYVAGALTTSIFVINVILDKPIIDALLFSLAIAVGITPQLLPAVVSTSLAAGSRHLARRKVLVKRLVCIEDLGDIDLLFTDKTGTLTLGRIDYARAVPAGDNRSDTVLRWGLLCTEVSTDGTDVAANPLDQALWESPATASAGAAVAGHQLCGVLPFDHERRMLSVVVRDDDDRLTLVTKGAPETVLERCVGVDGASRRALDAEFHAGNRVVAVATREIDRDGPPVPSDEHDLQLRGLLVFLDPPKPDAAAALGRLTELGIRVKVVTGDNAQVAAKVCADLGLPGGDPLTGTQIDSLDDAALTEAVDGTTVFARVSPEHKARIVKAHRTDGGGGVAFLGDGVNDALALHAADVGISVDSGTDVAKDAADVILLEKSLDVLADGVEEGRRIFANTLKYVLMGTSSNFGNMASAAGASMFLPFLPMLPSQILLGNLLYDTGQLAIPTDHVDRAQLLRPSHWDIAFIRRFMLLFGPLSSVFDFLTFAVMLWGFHAGPELFRTGWFVESLATQTLVIFAIRTRVIPFFRSRPSLPLTLAALGVVTVGAVLPATPLAGPLGFAPLPGGFFAALVVMVVCYLALVEVGKRWFYRESFRAQAPTPQTPAPTPTDTADRFVRRRAARFSAGARRRRRPAHP